MANLPWLSLALTSLLLAGAVDLKTTQDFADLLLPSQQGIEQAFDEEKDPYSGLDSRLDFVCLSGCQKTGLPLTAKEYRLRFRKKLLLLNRYPQKDFVYLSSEKSYRNDQPASRWPEPRPCFHNGSGQS
ncbi:MAG: hypothetical protein LKM30_09035 [Bacilli bacterium]|jgi:hypothetical protein|nr:hypothetical protein [Bacilli bacterium]